MTDDAGNTATSSNSPSFTLDTTADAGAALTLSAFDATGGVSSSNVSVSLTGIDSDIASGTITLTDGDGHTATYNLTAADIAAGHVTVGSGAFAGFAGLDHIDSPITVTAAVTDDAGNTATSSNSPSFTLDTTADAGAALTLSAFDATGGVSSS
ncbi:hypothetical protein, partial [Bradyrhizobium sp. NAS96.2]|uniref:hypothetical protein n=1 Tax=Bradyrhizobium sp. NAS96.2 TaxID=1680160 RepID=UPI001160FCCA